jgi:hypothetical protein
MLVLDSLATAYDNYIVHNAVVQVQGMGPTTSNSTVVCCLDFEPGTPPSSVEGISKHIPHLCLPGYRSGTLRATKRSLMRRNMYLTGKVAEPTVPEQNEQHIAFQLAYGVNMHAGDSFVWRVYCSYSITFLHPAPNELP